MILSTSFQAFHFNSHFPLSSFWTELKLIFIDNDLPPQKVDTSNEAHVLEAFNYDRFDFDFSTILISSKATTNSFSLN